MLNLNKITPFYTVGLSSSPCCCFYFRLNKIGKNPHLVSDRENLDSDCKTVNAIVNALSGPEAGSADSLNTPPPPRIHNNLRNLGRMIAEANLPRASSSGHLAPTTPTNLSDRTSFSKSDIFLERSPSRLSGLLLADTAAGPRSQVAGPFLFTSSPPPANST